jgi:hypothetical protein
VKAALALALVGALSGVARAEDNNCKALEMREPTEADFEKCLKKRPVIEAGVIGSLMLGGTDGFQASLNLVVDAPIARPVYLSTRARLGSNWSEVDLFAGYVLSFRYGAGDHTTISQSNTYHSPTATGYSYTTTTTAHSSYVVQRESWVLLAGVKGTRTSVPDDLTMGEPAIDKFKTLQFGIARHYANSDGQHIRMELIGMKRADKWGVAVRWFNAIVGMEIGMQPLLDVSTGPNESVGTIFYWNFVDLGLFKDF